MSKLGKSTFDIAWNALNTIGAALITAWMAIGLPTATDREVLGFILSTCLLTATLVPLFRSIFFRGDQPIIAQVIEETREAHTGTWSAGPDGPAGAVTTVRYDPRDGLFYVSGWISEYYQIVGEKPWYEVWNLKAIIRELEVDGLEPAADPGTERVRALLGYVRQ